jgi:hypothetical protein
MLCNRVTLRLCVCKAAPFGSARRGYIAQRRRSHDHCSGERPDRYDVGAAAGSERGCNLRLTTVPPVTVFSQILRGITMPTRRASWEREAYRPISSGYKDRPLTATDICTSSAGRLITNTLRPSAPVREHRGLTPQMSLGPVGSFARKSAGHNRTAYED